MRNGDLLSHDMGELFNYENEDNDDKKQRQEKSQQTWKKSQNFLERPFHAQNKIFTKKVMILRYYKIKQNINKPIYSFTMVNNECSNKLLDEFHNYWDF